MKHYNEGALHNFSINKECGSRKSSQNFWMIGIQSNLAISNPVNSKSPLFRRKIECPWIYPSPLRFPGYFEAPLFRTFFHFPWDFEIAGFDCISRSLIQTTTQRD